MKTRTINLFFMLGIITSLMSSCAGCNRVLPNHEGVLMVHYGRNGKEDFKDVSGGLGPLAPDAFLYQVPMFEQRADCPKLTIYSKENSAFTIDPTYTYKAIRGKGIDIVFDYKQYGAKATGSDSAGGSKFMNGIEANILNPIVLNAYREEAQLMPTDSLLNHMAVYEKRVESRLLTEFNDKYFELNLLSSGLIPPPSMVAAIEARNNSVIQAEKVSNDINIAKMQLQKDSIEMMANAIKERGLTPRILQEKWIDAILRSQNRIIITDGKTPILLSQ